MNDYALAVENLVKVYKPRGKNPVRAVEGMSFAVKRGQIFGLLGPNGAGKTTILKVLTTLLPPTEGRAEVMGFDVVARVVPPVRFFAPINRGSEMHTDTHR